MKDLLGERMKGYENIQKNYLMRNCPKIIRLDMRAGHTFTRDLEKPFDSVFTQCMDQAALDICREIPGVLMAYVQSDECSLLIKDETTNEENPCWFNGNQQKIVSLSAAAFSLSFSKEWYLCHKHMNSNLSEDKTWQCQFDSRVFCLPSDIEAHNYFVWRQKDAIRNALNTKAQSIFSNKELFGKSQGEVKEMLLEEGIDWDKEDPNVRFGRLYCCQEVENTWYFAFNAPITKKKIDYVVVGDIPIFTDEPDFIPNLYRRGYLEL